MSNIEVFGVDISHMRLVELAKLADQAKPFYNWVEECLRHVMKSHSSMNDLIHKATVGQLEETFYRCFRATGTNVPLLVDGIARPYGHQKACYYFLAWMIRDAPQQRLHPLVAAMGRQESHQRLKPVDYQVKSLAALFIEYRSVVENFEWPAIREVVIDRLEGSRRSLKGLALEAFTRSALVQSVQKYFAANGHYGDYQKIAIADKQVSFSGHTFDSSMELTRQDGTVRHLLIPVKTRETQGGGHAHLFTRDVVTAITETKLIVPDAVVCLVIVAQFWSEREIAGLGANLDLVLNFNQNPNAFKGFGPVEQQKLDKLVQELLDGNI